LVKKGQFFEVETSWSNGGESGRKGREGLVNQVNINEVNPKIKKYLARKQTGSGLAENPAIV